MEDSQFTLKLNAKSIFIAGVLTGVVLTLAVLFIIAAAKGGSLGGMFAGSLERKPLAVVEGGNNNPPPTHPSAAPGGNTEPAGAVSPVTSDDHLRGDKNATVTLIEYSDFQCPFCSRFHPTMLQVMNDYKGKVRWVYRHFPLNSIHPYAEKAAEASECASEQGKFWEMADQYFSTQNTWVGAGLDQAHLDAIAKAAGVRDLAKFDSCVTSGKYASVVQADEKSGEAAGVTGTPGTIVMDKHGKTQMIPGALPYDSVKQIVEAALKS